MKWMTKLVGLELNFTCQEFSTANSTSQNNQPLNDPADTGSPSFLIRMGLKGGFLR